MYLVAISLILVNCLTNISSVTTCDCTIAPHLPCEYIDMGSDCKVTDLDNTGDMWPGAPTALRMEQVNQSHFNLTWRPSKGAGDALLGFQIQLSLIVNGIIGIRHCVVYNLTNAQWQNSNWLTEIFFLDCIDILPGTNMISAVICSLPLNQVSSNCRDASLTIEEIGPTTPDPIKNWNPSFHHTYANEKLNVVVSPPHRLATKYTMYLGDKSCSRYFNKTDIYGNQCKATFTNVGEGTYCIGVGICDDKRCYDLYMWQSDPFTLPDIKLDPNVCEENPCLNDGACNPEPTGYECLCVNGYFGKNCENGPPLVTTPPPGPTVPPEIVYIIVATFAGLVVLAAMVVIAIFIYKRRQSEADMRQPLADDVSMGSQSYIFNDEERIERTRSDEYRPCQNGHGPPNKSDGDMYSMDPEIRDQALCLNAPDDNSTIASMGTS